MFNIKKIERLEKILHITNILDAKLCVIAIRKYSSNYQNNNMITMMLKFKIFRKTAMNNKKIIPQLIKFTNKINSHLMILFGKSFGDKSKLPEDILINICTFVHDISIQEIINFTKNIRKILIK